MDAGWLVVGLGNPGSDYAGNRHNVGFMVVDELARRWGQARCFSWQVRQRALVAGLPRPAHPLQKPQEYMNVSGGPVQRAMAFFASSGPRCSSSTTRSTCLSAPAGQSWRGHGGHNGLRSISQAVGSDYLRLRFGVGRPEHPQARSDSRER